MNHDVFISYSSKNTTTALAMCHVLEQHRIKCWMAPRDTPPGYDYADVIDEAIIACRVFVIIFSEPASVSQWVKRELSLAASEEKHIISKNTKLEEFLCSGNPGDGTVFPVTAWFGNSAIPNAFTTGDWDCDGTKITVDYRKAE